MSSSSYTAFVSSFGGIETGIMATLAGGPSYFIPFSLFGYYKTKADVERATNKMRSIADNSRNPSDRIRSNIRGRGNDFFESQNSYFWVLTIVAVSLAIIAISLLSCLVGVTPDEDFKETKRRRRRLLEDPKISPEQFAYTIASCTPNEYRFR
ncbi:hypothetical protein FG386_002328 [Cryptosporidium ryanae]|uniref:uncharacterized protein n=1 Tax=Cryptosporidium ryanae TaxID=515981 RepID=UPI00351A669E|nr:hypothetical protein FG386_002328 [Cryptosporidium ryanae]